jgi:amino-acid N-acetyltransferase
VTTTRDVGSRAAAVRPATGEDHVAVIGLLEAASLPVAGVPPLLEDFYVAERAGRIVGAIGVERYGRYGLLRSAVVDPSARGTGVGEALVERVLRHAREGDLRAVYLLTTTAEGYFPRFGFERIAREDVPGEVKVSVEFREACPASAVVMRKTLES